MKKLTLLIGLPGSGKSTLTSKIKKDSTMVISTDDLRYNNFGPNFSEEIKEKVFEMVLNNIINFSKNTHQYTEAILDTTYLNESKNRDLLVSFLKKHSLENVLSLSFYNLNTPLNIAIERDGTRKGPQLIGPEIINKLNKVLQFVSEKEITNIKSKGFQVNFKDIITKDSSSI